MVSEKNIKTKVGILTGPTGSGKTSIAIQWCLELIQKHGKKIAIINGDSLLFYRDFNIGTAKPKDFEKKGIPHHLIDHIHPEENYSSGDYYKDACSLISKLNQENTLALIVGGSGFYLKPFLYGSWNAPKAPKELRDELESHNTATLWNKVLSYYDKPKIPRFSQNDRYRIIRALEIIHTTGQTPEEHEQVHKSSTLPSPFQTKLWVIDWPKEVLQKRISLRAEKMIEEKWIEETENLRIKYPNARALKSVGYREIINYLDNIKPKGRKIQNGTQGLLDEIYIANNQLIKKQRTWFRGENSSQSFLLHEDLDKLKKEFFSFYLEAKV